MSKTITACPEVAGNPNCGLCGGTGLRSELGDGGILVLRPCTGS
jgi:hypothetical protein